MMMLTSRIGRDEESNVSEGRLRTLYERRRDELGLSDSEVMRAAGLSQNWWTEFKSGRKASGARRPGPDTLRKLARGLQLPYSTVARAAASDMYDIDLMVNDDRYAMIVGRPQDGDLPDEKVAEVFRRAVEELRRIQQQPDE